MSVPGSTPRIKRDEDAISAFSQLVSRHGASMPCESYAGQTARLSMNVSADIRLESHASVSEMHMVQGLEQLARSVPAGCAGCSYMRLRAEVEQSYMLAGRTIHLESSCAGGPYTCPRSPESAVRLSPSPSPSPSPFRLPVRSKLGDGLATFLKSGSTSTDDPAIHWPSRVSALPDPLMATAEDFEREYLVGAATKSPPEPRQPTSAPKTKPALVW